MRLDILIRRALRNASPAEAERIRRALREGQVAEVLPELVKLAEREGPLDIYYVSGSRFEAVEEREEAVGEVEEAVAEDGLEPVGGRRGRGGRRVFRPAHSETGLPRGEAPRKEAVDLS